MTAATIVNRRDYKGYRKTALESDQIKPIGMRRRK
jgi:hypothetical protein